MKTGSSRRTRDALLSLAGALALLLVFVAGCGGEDAPKLSRPDETGQELVVRFVELVKTKDVKGLEGFLSEGFIIQRADGSFAAKKEYLTILPAIGTYRISDVTARQDGAALVVRFSLTIDEVIDGRPFSTQPAPRLSTFVWDGDAWRMTSHANFNTPAAPNASRR